MPGYSCCVDSGKDCVKIIAGIQIASCVICAATFFTLGLGLDVKHSSVLSKYTAEFTRNILVTGALIFILLFLMGFLLWQGAQEENVNKCNGWLFGYSVIFIIKVIIFICEIVLTKALGWVVALAIFFLIFDAYFIFAVFSFTKEVGGVSWGDGDKNDKKPEVDGEPQPV